MIICFSFPFFVCLVVLILGLVVLFFRLFCFFLPSYFFLLFCLYRHHFVTHFSFIFILSSIPVLLSLLPSSSFIIFFPFSSSISSSSCYLLFFPFLPSLSSSFLLPLILFFLLILIIPFFILHILFLFFTFLPFRPGIKGSKKQCHLNKPGLH